MKAKEYAQKYRDEGQTLDSLLSIWKSIFFEFRDIADKRHAETNGAAYAIYKELDQKWKAFAREFKGEVNQDGFSVLLKEFSPDLWNELEQTRIFLENRYPM